jgi:quinoprotein glucose dehydrogenase
VAVPGWIRGYDARTGALLWAFHTVPLPGEPGSETWEDNSASYTGNTAVWAPFSADATRGLVYLPVEAPTADFYGGHRRGNNLFSDALVCIDARTGKRLWHYQIVHHDIWDYDLPAAPVLADITVKGRKIPAVVQVTKMGLIFVFDRVTGKPVWPIEERPVPQTDVPGEKTSRTQPYPTRPSPYEPQGLRVEDLIDFTPDLKRQAEAIVKDYRFGPAVGRRGGRKSGLAAAALSVRRIELAGRRGRPGDGHLLCQLHLLGVPHRTAPGSEDLG